MFRLAALFLCATSVSSVSLWWIVLLTTETQRTQRLHRENRIDMKTLLITLVSLLVFTQGGEPEVAGRWQVKFTFAGRTEMNLIFEAKDKGDATFLLLDTAPDSKPETSPRPATWTQTTNNRMSFSGEVELPIGDCCRETGTLLFKGKLTPDKSNSLSGKVIFIASTEDEENGVGFRTMAGTFTATRVADAK